MLTERNCSNESVEVKELQEIISLLSRLSPDQKKTVLATIRGAVLIADSGNGGDQGVA